MADERGLEVGGGRAERVCELAEPYFRGVVRQCRLGRLHPHVADELRLAGLEQKPGEGPGGCVGVDRGGGVAKRLVATDERLERAGLVGRAKPVEPTAVDLSEPAPAAGSPHVGRLEHGGDALVQPDWHRREPLGEAGVVDHLMRRLVHQRGDEARRLGLGEDGVADAARSRGRAAAREVVGRHSIAEEVVVARDPVGGGSEVAGGVGLVVGTPREDHHDERTVGVARLEARLPPEIAKRLVQTLEERRRPLGVVSRRVEADDVVPREMEIEPGRQFRQDPPAEVARGFGSRWRDWLSGPDLTGLHHDIPLAGEFEQQSAIDRLGHDPPLDGRRPDGRCDSEPGIRPRRIDRRGPGLSPRAATQHRLRGDEGESEGRASRKHGQSGSKASQNRSMRPQAAAPRKGRYSMATR